jgi:hypothetical protein
MQSQLVLMVAMAHGWAVVALIISSNKDTGATNRVKTSSDDEYWQVIHFRGDMVIEILHVEQTGYDQLAIS